MRAESVLIFVRIHRELMQALERARSRLAIAAAADARFTPLRKRRDYLETEERIMRCLRDLRGHQRCDRHIAPTLASGLLEKLAPLVRHETRRGDARVLDQALQEVLSSLEQMSWKGGSQ
jgi:hypothetical protein